MSGPWKHDANRGAFENVLDPGTVFGTNQYDPGASVRALQITIRRTFLTRIWRARRTQSRQVFFAPGQMTELSHCIAIEQDQNPAKPSGLLYGIATLVTSSSEPSGLVAYPTSFEAFP